MSIRHWSRGGLKGRAVTVGWWALGAVACIGGFSLLNPPLKAVLTTAALICACIVFIPPKAVSRFMAELRGTTYIEPVSTEHLRVSDRSYPLTIKLPVAVAAGASLWVIAQGIALTWRVHPWIVVLNVVLVVVAILAYSRCSAAPTDVRRPTVRTSHRQRLSSVTLSKRSPNTIEELTTKAMTASLKEYAERQEAEAAEIRDRERFQSALIDEKGEPV